MPTTIELETLTPEQGFAVVAVSGPVSAAGDVNGDGFDDLVFGAPNDNRAYVVFGQGNLPASIDLSSLGSGGAVIQGVTEEDYDPETGSSVSFAGDVNGDGFDDILLGAPGNDYGHTFGAVYVIFGNDDFANIDLDDFSPSVGDIREGSLIDWGTYLVGTFLGSGVASAGDVNGDGYDESILSVLGERGPSRNAPQMYLGENGGFGSSIGLDLPNGARSLVVSSVGDVNGDSFGDLVASFHRTNTGGYTRIYFGESSGHLSDFVDLALANVSSLGDVNGDGFGDFSGSSSGGFHVVFGRDDFVGPIGVADAAFSILGSPFDLAGVGDVNGDGFADIAVRTTGGARIILGHAGQFASVSTGSEDQFSLIIEGPVSTIAAAGDVNGDGCDDILVTTADDTYVVYGSADLTIPDADDVIEGDASGNMFFGAGGDDTINGYGGADNLYGGTGDDTLSGHDGEDRLFGDDGADRLYGGLLTDWLYGGAGNDTLNGQDGNDTLDGGAGNDTMRGGTGDDSYLVDSAADKIIEAAGEGIDRVTANSDYVLSDNVENLVMAVAGHAGTGNALANVIDGSIGVDTLSGLAGDDTLSGFGGDDTLAGGAGVDTLYGHDGRDALSGGSENDTLFGGLQRDTVHGDDGDDLVNGQDGNDVLYGDAGNDNVVGGTGDDTMRGGVGDDRYSVDSAGDQVIERAGEGTDTVTAGIDYTLTGNVENLILTGSARIGTGNVLANTIEGSGGNDTLSGLDGNDTLSGNAGGDEMLGGAGDDVLDGGAGRDVMTGGAGRDLYVFDDGDMLDIRDHADRILDFDQAAHERIRLNLVDADTTLAGDQAFAFLGSGAFTGDAGELRSYSLGDGSTYVEADVNGDAAADWFIALTGTITLTAGDFVL